uniref:NADH-ubiquinone oxidoreductase chain 4 n=1 Tax=Clovia sp. EMHAU-2015-Zz052918 TaxID=2038646 RepID=A0A343K659_9HEMI|nr:NADH dehydrogenase subunit 4 [Clovia sp. EMHAU-2015-Zz052918]
MLKLFFYSIMLIPMFSNFWVIQSLIMTMCFIMLFFNVNKDYSFMGYYLSLDSISIWLIILTIWISSLMFLASYMIKKKNNYENQFSTTIILLLITLMLSFSTTNLMLFYFFFESSLIPTMIMIFGWGYQPERLNSGFYMLFYTLMASLPLIMSILMLYKINGSCSLMIIKNESESIILFLGLIMAFLVKLPMFMFHFWLPKAHVEAPISGSMMLAAILLKLGGYGITRVLFLCPNMFNQTNYIWMSISLYGGIMISAVCLIQSDLKSLIAYSSISHMSLVIMGMVTMLNWGLMGSMILMIGHGLCSSGLFCLANIIYSRTKSRSLFINKGFLSFMPSMTLMWFLFCSSNMASPPSINLTGEIMIFNTMMSWSQYSMFFLMLMSFLSASYSFYLFAYTQHGNFYSGMISFSMGKTQEYLLLMLHWLPLNLMIMKIDVMI